ncbi:protein kinase family protein [Ectopseudomonas khazarica]|uniref:protein kinase n=1 Tax=Ectopseudomonas khazarica TaxID=2502979 RepID=UPI00106DE0C1|nr:protein kinase [Pseudomonas khazarica]
MALQLLEHPGVSLASGAGLDLPQQAARTRAMWLAGRQQRPPLLLVMLLWARHCPDVVQYLERHLDALFADFRCTPQSWSETQAARQVLAALNLQLFRRRQSGQGVAELHAGMLLIQGEELQFLQAGSVGLTRVRCGAPSTLVGRDGQALGGQAELALVQHSLLLQRDERVLLAPQPLLDVSDLQALCGQLDASPGELLQPLLQAPGAAVLLRAGAGEEWPVLAPVASCPALAEVACGQRIDGWTLRRDCAYGPAGRMFLARDEAGRDALLWFAEEAADEAFWQREWALRRSTHQALPQVLSSLRARTRAYLVLAAPPRGMRNLVDWVAAQGAPDAQTLLSVLAQLIGAVRSLQRRGMQGLWLNPRQILLGDDGRVLLLPGAAAILPTVARQLLPEHALPLAPELRSGRALDGRADQFALAALAYWLLCGQWPEAARADVGPGHCYVPLANFAVRAPQGWDGVLARALAPQPQARFEALSEFQLALQQPLQQRRSRALQRPTLQPARLLTLAALVLPLLLGLLLSLGG